MCRRIIVEEVSTVSGTRQETTALVIRVKELIYIFHINHQFGECVNSRINVNQLIDTAKLKK